MKRTYRHKIAAILGTIYILIALSPMVPCFMKSATVAHAVSGECSGNCDIDGCSTEKRTSHTCCCWLKKKMKHEGHHNQNEHEAGDSEKKHKATTVLSCGCPSGKGKQLALWGAKFLDILPCKIIGENTPPEEVQLYLDLQPRQTLRHYEPPDPPPKLTIIS